MEKREILQSVPLFRTGRAFPRADLAGRSPQPGHASSPPQGFPLALPARQTRTQSSACFGRAGLASLLLAPALLALAAGSALAQAQPTCLDSRLRAEVVASGLPSGIDDLASAIVLLDERTALVAIRTDGSIHRIDLPALSLYNIPPVPARLGPTVVDLDIITRTPGDGQSEYGVQGLTLDPNFPSTPYIYIRYDHSLVEGQDSPQADLNDLTLNADSVVERFIWDPSGNNGAGSLTFDARLWSSPMVSKLHHGGQAVFGPDGNLYIPIGNQQVVVGRSMNTNTDVFFQAGCIHRVTPDGSTPADNPFVNSGVPGTERWFAYGYRNPFGAAFDPGYTGPEGSLWVMDNGEDTYDELNRVPRSANGGWQRIAGPSTHPRQTGSITDLIQTPGNPDSFYVEPKYSWYQTIGVTGVRFLYGSVLGPAFDDWVLTANYNTPFLFRFILNEARTDIVVQNPGLRDLVDDRVPSNRNPIGTESAETLLCRGVGAPFSGSIAIASSPRLRIPYILTADGRIIRLTRTCWADVASGSGDPGADSVVDGSDFVAYINAFTNSEPLADISSGEEPGPDGVIDGNDFVTFVISFSMGC